MEYFIADGDISPLKGSGKMCWTSSDAFLGLIDNMIN